MELTKHYSLPVLQREENICHVLEEADKAKIAFYCMEGFDIDEQSRESWMKRTSESMKLALQVVEQKSFPWAGASNVKFPLITIAALQYHSRSYPMLVSGPDVVKMRVVGTDLTGEKTAKANRVSAHMSYQVLEEDEAWEEEMDKVLIHAPIVGCAFKKVYYSEQLGHNVSEFVPAADLVINYWASSIAKAQRVSHIIPMSRNDIRERIMMGLFCETDLKVVQMPVLNELDHTKNKAQKMMPPSQDYDGPVQLIEQHTWIDMDGDGYQEPYIVTFRRDTRQLLRMQARWVPTGVKYKNGQVVSIRAEVFFTKYPFIPSPDGGFYDLGFGSLLGPVNDSINTLINQLIDAGTMANTAGGFLSRGVKIRGGATTFAPLEWKPVESSGDDLRKGIMPLPVREPSQVLFTLLSLLINYGERIGMATDALVGENPGQNTPAETSRNMQEQGLKIFSGIFKRAYRSLRDEFRMLYKLNKIHLPNEVEFGDGKSVIIQDYMADEATIVPSADPNVVSDSQRLQQATMVKQSSMQTPGYDRYEVEKNFLEALKIRNIDQLFPNPKGPNAVPPPQNPKVEIEKMKVQAKMKDSESKAKIKAAELMSKAQESQATVDKMRAETIKIMKEADSVQTRNMIELLRIKMQAEEARRDDQLELAKVMLDLYQFEETLDEPGQDSGTTGGAAKPS